MKVSWKYNRCIFCLNENNLCEEHLIPESLGGNLTCDFLCPTCNSIIGHDLEAKAKADPSVLIAAKHLESCIPDLAASLLVSHPYIGHSQPGPTKGHIRNGEFKVRSQKLDDGSLIQPTDHARNSIFKIMKKKGYKKAPIESALQAFDSAPEDTKLEIAPGLEIAKWSIQRLELDLSSAELMNPLIPAKTAYEFLACHIGSAIYGDVPQLSDVRNSLMTGLLNEDVVRVERLSSNKYEPFHGIYCEGNDPYTKIQIRLFGWLAFRVHFLCLSIQGPRFVYTHRLDTKSEDVQVIEESNMCSVR